MTLTFSIFESYNLNKAQITNNSVAFNLSQALPRTVQLTHLIVLAAPAYETQRNAQSHLSLLIQQWHF